MEKTPIHRSTSRADSHRDVNGPARLPCSFARTIVVFRQGIAYYQGAETGCVMIEAAKTIVRAAFRIVAFLIAYSVAKFRAAGPAALSHAVVEIWPFALIFAVIGFGYDTIVRRQRTPWRFTSVRDIVAIIRDATFVILAFLLVVFLTTRALHIPRLSVLMTWVIDLGMICSVLLVRRAYHEGAIDAVLPFLRRTDAKNLTPMLLIGGLDRADLFLRQINRNPGGYRPVGIITDADGSVGRELHGVRVLASLAGARAAIDSFTTGDITGHALLFLDDGIVPADLDAEQLGQLRTRGAIFLRQSRLVDLAEGGGAVELQEINVEDLLSRSPVQLDVAAIRQLVSGKRIMVTGAGGSIGSEICRQVAALGCAHISFLDNWEFGLFKIDMEIGDTYPTLSRHEILCDVRDGARVSRWIEAEDTDILFHAAAVKHVPMVEKHPDQGVLTNVLGTWNVAEAAMKNQVEHMVFISTDKAVDPSSVMGATKRLAESVVRTHQAAASETRFSVVRFGNVLGSAGSVVPTFKMQIERGGPVTVTHPDVERYFMTIPEAVQLVLHATAKSEKQSGKRPGVFVLDMGRPVRIMDLAHQMIELYGKTPGVDIAVQITGLRPGEKLTEELVDSTEEISNHEEGVLHVVDRLNSFVMKRSQMERLVEMARRGDIEGTRQGVFDMLTVVRAAPSVTNLTA
jgi:O-antigen biosynthesis protein WbqV